MKRKNRHLIYPSFVLGLLLIISINCKKEEKNSPQGDGGISSVVFNPNLNYGTMTDQDGNVYKTITIGTQTWMAENLRVTKYRNGDPIPKVFDKTSWFNITTGAYCSYAYTTNKDEIATYGRLYNWLTVGDIRNIAPTGWHVPTDDEWTTLKTYLGGEILAGANMKETGVTHWISPNNGSTNESGFAAIPGGLCRDGGSFTNLGYAGYWWSSTDIDSIYAFSSFIGHDSTIVYRFNFDKHFGFSVRCLQD